MRIRNAKAVVKGLLAARFLGRRIPLAIRWQLTDRCVLKCAYCNVWKIPREELGLDQIRSLLDEMALAGVKTISFSGGEPMLRPDIAQILEETATRGISTEMNSTGARIPEMLPALRHLDFLKISLDGPEKVHNAVRGTNAYQMAIRAAEAAQAGKLRFIFSTTLTKFNIRETGFLLETAKKFNTLVAFQPLKKIYRGVEDVRDLVPEEKDYKEAIRKLIAEKKRGNPHLRNSLIGLWHIAEESRRARLKCWAGKIFCVLGTDGTLMPCDRIAYASSLPNCLKTGFAAAFSSLPEVCCGGCGFCGPLELNFLMSFRFGTIGSILQVVK